MTTIRLFCNNDLKENSTIFVDKVNYIVNVMKRKIGDKIIFVNGKDGEFLGRIEKINKKEIEIFVEEKIRNFYKSNFLGLIFSPIQKIDLLVKNATELGTTDFFPFKSQYTQYISKISKIEANIIEAVEQCERLDLPTLHKEDNLKNVLNKIEKDSIIIFCEERSNNKISQMICDLERDKKIYVLVGGEGGFSEEEKALIKSYKNVKSVSLGNRILRAENAVSSILSIVQNFYLD